MTEDNRGEPSFSPTENQLEGFHLETTVGEFFKSLLS